jgi:hypothetical protein
MENMMRSLGRPLLLLFLALSGCDVESPCDPGQRHEQGICVADDDTPAAGRGGADGDDAGPAGRDAAAVDAAADHDAGPATCSEDRDAILGAECSDDDGCNCAAPYCAKQPGQRVGFCTVYCVPDPDDCPAGYHCFDLSALGVEGYEPFCIPE